MIDKENEIYTRVYNKVIAKYPDVNMDGSFQAVPSGFPHVTFYESDSYVSERYDDGLTPKYEIVRYSVNIYSNKISGKKQECKDILAVIDDEMHRMNFRRMIMTPVPNLNDSSIYRVIAEYEAVISENMFFKP